MSLLFLAKRFVAGEEFHAVIPVIQRLNGKGLEATVNMLGEHVKDQSEADRAVKEYVAVLDRVRRNGLRTNVSIKPTQMGLDIDQELCYKNVAQVAEKAAECENFIRLDMEGSPYTQRTLDLFFRLFERYQNVGIVIQAYLHRSEEDIDALNQIKARVRLCKGAYKEPPGVAIQQMDDIRKNFLKLAEKLLTNGHYPGIATHDDILIGGVKRLAATQGIGADRFEFQMLYGLRSAAQEKIAQEGYRMRVYVPYGPEWMPYFYRRLRERKENVWFVVKNLFKK
jgi:proline dehydrogenase